MPTLNIKHIKYIILFVVSIILVGCNEKNIEGIRVFSGARTQGLTQDSRILQGILSQSIAITDEIKDPDSRRQANLFIETVDDLGALRKANQNWLLINQEFTQNSYFLKEIDLVLCKSLCAANLMKELRRKHNLKYKIIHIKFTTQVASKFGFEQRDQNLFFHGAGSSAFKNTRTVLETWRTHPEFPKLVVTCRNAPGAVVTYGCKKDHLEPEHAWIPNVELYEFLSKDALMDTQQRAGVFVTPSAVEGYGHYINEGRALGALVITTDAPPMNELIQDGVTGFLVPLESSYLFNLYTRAEYHQVSREALAKVVEKVRLLTTQERLQIAQNARKAYEEDTQFLTDRLTQLALSLHQHGDLRKVDHLLE